MVGKNIEIEIKFGLDMKFIKAVVLEYIGNGEYIVEGDNGNRYIRRLESDNV